VDEPVCIPARSMLTAAGSGSRVFPFLVRHPNPSTAIASPTEPDPKISVFGIIILGAPASTINAPANENWTLPQTKSVEKWVDWILAVLEREPARERMFS